MKITEVSVHRPVLVSVVFAGVILFASVAFTLLPVDLFPEIEPPVLSVITVYPGASAEDVEEKISEVVEESLGALADLKEITSISKENLSVVTLQFEFGAALDEAANDIRQNLEFAKQKLPSGIDPPILFQFDTSKFPVVMFAVVSKTGDIHKYRKLVEERVLDPLKRIPGVGSVQIFNAPEEQLLVEVERARLAAYNVTIGQVARVIGAENLSFPAGHLEFGSMEFAVRMPAEFQSVEDAKRVVLARHNGGVVRLGDVAQIHRGVEQLREIARVDGQKAIVGGIMKRSGANTVDISDRVSAKLEQLQKTLPASLSVVPVIDTSLFIRLMISNLTRTLVVAGILVVLIVLFFLRRLRSSFIIAMAIPGSMMIAFLLMYLAEYTLNAISMMAMALAVGMVVDNAIVVLENITRHVDEGEAPRVAAVKGTLEMSGAITASTLTTLSVFGPLLFVTGLIGVMFGQLAFVISVTVGSSLLVALTLTPMMCGRLLRPVKSEVSGGRLGAAAENAFVAIDNLYRRTLRFALDHRAIVAGIALLIVVATFGLLRAVGADFMPEQNSGQVRLVAELPIGTAVADSARVGELISAELHKQPEVKRVFYQSGTSKGGFGTAIGGKEGSHIVKVTAVLIPFSERTRTDADMADHLRQFAKGIPEISNLTISAGSMLSSMLMGMAKPLTIELLGSNFDDLSKAAKEVERLMAQVPGTVDVAADLMETRPEVRFTLDRERASRMMVPAAAAGMGLRAALYGGEVSKYRADGEDLPIYVRLREEDRQSTDDLMQVQVASMSGALVRLGDIGSLIEGQSAIEIKRKDKQRLLTVGANIKGRPLGDVVADLDEKLATADIPASVAVRFGGDAKEQRDTFQGLIIALLLGFVLVYLVMAGQFESFIDPFIIVFAIPFAITGAFLFLLMTGTTLSIPAFLGLVILLGIVVNNGIVLVDYINSLRREQGLELREAIEVGAQRRLRPVLMTTATTAFGMLPLAIATGEGSGIWAPMGRAAIGGLLFSAVVTLVLVPVIYSFFERLRRKKHVGQEAGEGWSAETV